MNGKPVFPIKTLNLSKGSTAYIESGSGPSVVCIHGIPGVARDFRWLFPPLEHRARMIAVDLPGFGETAVASGPDASPEGRAKFILEFIDALGLERPVLVGHSMGGLVAVAAVSLRPHGFRGLGLLSTPGLRPHAVFRRIPRRAMHVAMNGPWTPFFMPLARRLFSLSGFKGYPDSALVRTMACLKDTSFVDHAERIKSLNLPTLAAWCEDDPLIEPEILSELATALPKGPRLVWPTGGHVPQKTHAMEVATGISELLGG